jgi:4-amino-4-deoxy-L-arabinose transferase-like glycosyltransferase
MDPWLSFYAVAASFVVFGETEFAGRLPFALLGVASVLLTHLLARELYKDRWTGVVSASVLLLNVPFLLLSRQCRYYSMATFFTLLGLYGYQRVVRRRSNGHVILFCASVLLFHSQYLYSAVLLSSVLLHALLFHRPALRSLTLLAIGAGAVNALWIVGFAGLPQVAVQGGSQNFVINAWGYLRLVARWISPLWLVAVPLAAHGWSLYRRNEQPLLQFGSAAALLLPPIFLVVNIVALSGVTTWMMFRYLGPAIPPMCITLGALLRTLLPGRRVVFALCLVCFAVAGRMQDYLYEITHDYDGPIEGIVKYLKEHGKEGDLVAISFGDVPLEFYTSLRAVGLYYDEDLTPALQADWVVLRKYWDSARIRKFLEDLPREQFVAIPIDYPDLPFENIPEPDLHRFRTVTNEDKVVIYRRVRAGKGD